MKMNNVEKFPKIVELAYEIIDMHNLIKAQSREIVRLRTIEEEYNAFVESSVKHNSGMMHNLMKVLLTEGVGEQFMKNGKPEDFKG